MTYEALRLIKSPPVSVNDSVALNGEFCRVNTERFKLVMSRVSEKLRESVCVSRLSSKNLRVGPDESSMN